ncbi:putative L-lactate dehydrogenase, Iron-sulfur cluster-binding subunit YkgF [Indibacter alkaliphilus LW1]|uniref:L-lactate dehydrogenase, Iron-sulfur cluster-binding subunit YkgF n=1 Tax=Indibacter alkaliphilus (strain CCUG 57479 / KCTC 22604 / LW1) TaxID=1189612 RepID=S2D2E8_INDAL|nr:lactate utilization protein B [Indibacter alkaliphilus]EOZ93497.1 putative L-lactate dehydrogenase, Iron-sulfur cluster-binding subunit YkgF [Indibacter alkaliphilus LW1]
MSHPSKASEFLQDAAKAKWHDETLWFVRDKRDNISKTIPEWEELRELASQIKDNVLANLETYLVEFEKNAKANNIHVHWAKDAEEHNQMVLSILNEHRCKAIVKSKSILTEECHLNPFLEENGVEVVDTDLGERIVQFLNQPPSHIVLPAIHLKKRDISELFHEKLQTEKGNEDPAYLTHAARLHLREKFLGAKVAITGVNFGVAETGEFVVCTNEGNADMGVHLADIHIACMGVEKIIPRRKDLGVFLRLLARSATGQPITNYNSHFRSPAPGKEIHIVLVDNGRTDQLAREKFKNSLKCIRCGACMNTCPIYRRSGGYSYGSVVPGPIGSILSPGLDVKKYSTLPFASTLCGSCTDVCPVKINIHEQLYEWRQEITKAQGTNTKSISMKIANGIFAVPFAYKISGAMMRGALKILPDSITYSGLNTWGKQRDLPETPKETFKDWYKKNRT